MVKVGHSLFFSCFDKLSRCPVCQEEFSRPFMVNYAIQSILDSCNDYFNRDEIKRGYSRNIILNDKQRNYLRREDEHIVEKEVNYKRNADGMVTKEEIVTKRDNKNVFENEIVACIVLTSDNIHLER